MHTTKGNHALDLIISRSLTLVPKIPSYELPTEFHGPLPPKTIEMVLGRSSLTSQGFIVHPGIIGECFNGEIGIMTYIKKSMQCI